MLMLGERWEGVRTMLEGNSGAYAPPEGENRCGWWGTGTVKLTSEDTGGVYSVAEEISSPQGATPAHTRQNEVLYVPQARQSIVCAGG